MEQVKIVNDSSFDMPKYATIGSVGLDLRADFTLGIDDIRVTKGAVRCDGNTAFIQPKSICIFSTKLNMEIPFGYGGEIRPRSGLTSKTFLDVKQGTIDSDYTDHIGIICWNLSDEVVVVENGERIAQIVFSKCKQLHPKKVTTIKETIRGKGGFGHTGMY